MTQLEAGRDKPLVMSDALGSNTADEAALIRCHCLAHGRRKFSELEETFPAECTVVIEALKQVFDHEEEARLQQLSPTERLAYHQHASGPIMEAAQALAGAAVRGAQCRAQQQFRESVCLSPDPLADADAIFTGCRGRHSTTISAERALKLAIRQRKTVSSTPRTTAPTSPACSPASLPPVSTPG